MTQELKNKLSSLIDGEVEFGDDVLDQHSTDASIFKIRPQAVIFPKHAEDIQRLVRFAQQHKSSKLSFTIRSGGTDMGGGTLSESIVVNVSRHMNSIGKVWREEVGTDTKGYAIVEPGVFYRDFEKITLEHNLLLPSYPASREICTVGGMVANNAGGEKTLRYGKTEKYIAELKVILSDGNEYTIKPLSRGELDKKIAQDDFEGRLYKSIYSLIQNNHEMLKNARPNVSKNSAGYYLWNVWDPKTKVLDLTQLIVGSQGTLGIITDIKFKLIEPEPHSELLVIFMRNIDELAEIVNELLKHKPESLETYDNKTFSLVLKYIFNFLKLLGLKNIFQLAWSFLPEARLVLTGGLPRLVILAEFTGDNNRQLKARAERAKKAIDQFEHISTHLAKSDIETAKYWKIRREAFNLIRHHLKGEKSEPFIDDLIVKPEKLNEFLPRIYKLLEPYKKRMTYALGGHSGDGNMHIYSIMDPRQEGAVDLIKDLSNKAYDLVIEMGGSITAEHNDGLIRSPFLEKMYGRDVYNLFKEVKNIFDPSNIFNPGKKVEADFDYAMEHFNKG